MSVKKNSFYQPVKSQVTPQWSHLRITEVNFGDNIMRKWIRWSVNTYDTDGMKEFAEYTPIDYICDKYGVLQSDKTKPSSYLWKWIKDPDDIQAIDEYFAYVVAMFEEWEFTRLLREKDYEVEIDIDPADIKILEEAEIEKQKQERDAELLANANTNDVVKQLMQQNQLLMQLVQNAWLLPANIEENADKKDTTQEESTTTSEESASEEITDQEEVNKTWVGVDQNGATQSWWSWEE